MYNCILFITLSKLLKCRRKSIMKHLKAKTILAILYMLAAGLLAFLIIMFLYAAFELDDDFDESSQKLQSLTNIYDDMVTDFLMRIQAFRKLLLFLPDSLLQRSEHQVQSSNRVLSDRVS